MYVQKANAVLYSEREVDKLFNYYWRDFVRLFWLWLISGEAMI